MLYEVITNALGNSQDVHMLGGPAGVVAVFMIGASGVMAGKAVDLGFVGEIKSFVSPAVADVTFAAVNPVGFGRGTEVVEAFLRITSYNVCYTKLLRVVAIDNRSRFPGHVFQ